MLVGGRARRRNKLEDLEVYVYIDVDFYGFAILGGWLEFVLADGVDGLFVEAHAYATGDADVGGIALLVDDEIDLDVAGELGLASFFGELGVYLVDELGCGYAAADVVDAATGVAAGTGADAIAVS